MTIEGTCLWYYLGNCFQKTGVIEITVISDTFARLLGRRNKREGEGSMVRVLFDIAHIEESVGA
ncbi:hypothetical protein CW304_28740 [Bacillus sp. UFRGS-B20]|nr:hypothetical protein CW304_28740 [Bacillus sp. UFRGS-B20]